MFRWMFVTVAAVLLSAPARADENLLKNGGFEQGFADWNDFWSRTPVGNATLDTKKPHSGRQAVRIQHTGSRDWSFQQSKPLDVKPGEIYELSGWVRVEGEGHATLSVILKDLKDKTISWDYGGRSARATDGWRKLHARMIIPRGAATILPRLIGYGPSTVWFDGASLERVGTVQELRTGDLPDVLTARNVPG